MRPERSPTTRAIDRRPLCGQRIPNSAAYRYVTAMRPKRSQLSRLSTGQRLLGLRAAPAAHQLFALFRNQDASIFMEWVLHS